MSVFSTPIQEKSKNAWVSGTSLVISGLSAITNGNSLILRFTGANAAIAIQSIAQTGVVWTKAREHNTNHNVSIWYASAVTGAGTTITATVNTAPATDGSVAMLVSEWPGAITLDAINSASGSSTTSSSGSVTPTSGREALMIMTCRMAGTYGSGPTDSFTALLSGDATLRDIGGYRSVDPTTGASYDPQVTFATGAWASATATFLAPAATPTVTPGSRIIKLSSN